MLFDLMKINLGTVAWRAPNCVLQIPALKGNDTAGTTTHFTPGAHFGFLDLGGCDAAVAFSVRSWVAPRAAEERLQPVCHSSLSILQDWDHTDGAQLSFTNQEINVCVLSCSSKRVCDTWALTVGVLFPLHSLLLFLCCRCWRK